MKVVTIVALVLIIAMEVVILIVVKLDVPVAVVLVLADVPINAATVRAIVTPVVLVPPIQNFIMKKTFD